MLSSTFSVSSRSLAMPGSGQRAARAPTALTSTMTSTLLRCRIHFADDVPSPRLARGTRRNFVVASSSPSSPSNAQDDAVLKSIVEAAAAAAKAARASTSEATSSSSTFASVSSSYDASSSGLRGAMVSPRRTRMITFTCNKCGKWVGSEVTRASFCSWLVDSKSSSGPFFSDFFFRPLLGSTPRTLFLANILTHRRGSERPNRGSDSGEEQHYEIAFSFLSLLSPFLLLNFNLNQKKTLTDARTERSINPTAWDKGLVFVQCGTCQAWHKVADAAGLIDEVVFEPSEQTASLVRSDSFSSSTTTLPELAFESADEPHGLIPVERDDDDEEERD